MLLSLIVFSKSAKNLKKDNNNRDSVIVLRNPNKKFNFFREELFYYLGKSLDDLSRDCHQLRVRDLIAFLESNLTFNRFLRYS